MAILKDLCLLVVDDDSDSQILLTWILRDEGANVVTAASATEALEALERSQPDIVLSDIAMPEKDGYWLINQIRKRQRDKQLPAIAVTAVSTEESRCLALSLGYQMYFQKPIEPVQLVKAIANLVT